MSKVSTISNLAKVLEHYCDLMIIPFPEGTNSKAKNPWPFHSYETLQAHIRITW